ncbi:MAG TPA: glycosyltransferase, partial [Patescibacteria group bacterium]|nr:glycosyltransferase [Patescibacteria group bacterium]
MKVALVHDYLIQDGGAERVFLAMHELFPEAPVFTLFFNPEHVHESFRKMDVRASRLNRFPFAQTHYQLYLPFMAEATEAMDLSGFDLVLSSSSSFAKGVISPSEATHICYCHTPTRFLWEERSHYVRDLRYPTFVKWFLPGYLHRLRQWDRIAAERPDAFVTNSRTSRERIRRYYQREAEVIPPPVDVSRISVSRDPGAYWLAGGRLVPYKRFDLIVQAFAKLNLPLKIFGEGPERENLERLAGPKTEFLGHVDDQVKVQLYEHAIGFLYPQIEDFGITAVEAMAAGKPVIAYGRGGATETVVHGVTGLHFDWQCWEDIGNAVMRFDASRFDPQTIRAHAEQFSKERFQERMRQFIA